MNEKQKFSDGSDKGFEPRNRPDKRDLLKKKRSGGGSQGKPPKKGWPASQRIAFIILFVMMGTFIWKQINSPTAGFAKVSYTEFSELLKEQRITEAQIRGQALFGKLDEPASLGSNGRMADGVEVQIGQYDQQFIQGLVEQGVDVNIEAEKTWVNLLMMYFPWLFFIAIWVILMRQMQGGPKGVFSFGKSKAKLIPEDNRKITFTDVAGVEEAKIELEEIIGFLKDPRKFQRLGGKIPKGALLIGPPGTGKTLLARAVAGEAGVPFFSMSGSDFVEMFVGVGASRVRDLFEQGKTNAPCIIFIDEIDAVGRQRGAGIGGGHDEREQTLNQLLVEMDGFESNDGVILLAATNRPDVLDSALLRPGRFDRQIMVDWPDVNAREEILKVHARKIQIDPNVNMSNIAKGTPGMTGADLANIVNEAALYAARMNRPKVTTADFEEAKDKVMMGSARKTLVITENENRLRAYHEAGHVLVSKFVPEADPVHKVSIIARGRALGLTHFLPSDEKHNWSHNYCTSMMAVLLGGRAAEYYKFGDITNGASNDIERATGLARKMVCEWGMSKRLGPLTFGKKDNEIFLGREIATHKDYSEETAVAIDQEIRRFVDQAQQLAETIIRDHTDKLEILTSELLKKEVLSGDEIDRILNINGKNGPARKRPRRRRKPSGQRPKTDEQNKSAGQITAVAQAKQSGDVSGPVQAADSTKSVKVNAAAEQDNNIQKDTRVDEPAGDKGNEMKLQDKQSDKTNVSSKTGDRERRTRIVRLKTGGRQRSIRKAPAQKIRDIN